jgi:hypothetical protein
MSTQARRTGYRERILPTGFRPTAGGAVITKATGTSPQSGQPAAGGSAVVFLHGHQLERNLAWVVTAEATGTFVPVLAITSTAVAAALSWQVAGAPTAPWRCPSPVAWPWPSQSPASAIFPVATSTPQ